MANGGVTCLRTGASPVPTVRGQGQGPVPTRFEGISA